MPDFEKSFSDFIDRREYDEAEAALFSVIRAAFKAGWLSAGGMAPAPQKIVELIRPRQTASYDMPDSTINPSVKRE